MDFLVCERSVPHPSVVQELNVLIIESIYLIDIGLSIDCLFLLIQVFVDCIFQGIGLFHLGHQILGHRIVHSVPLLSFQCLWNM